VITFTEAQQRAYANKIEKGFNVTDIPLEFGLLYGEIGEAFDAWRKAKPNFGEELADITIYLLGLAGITGVDLGSEVAAKLAVNEARAYTALPNGTAVKAATAQKEK
jgi:NTP pyrophosphatase (non-canonical NTP hydrolase)